MDSKKRKQLTIKDKYEIIRCVENNEKRNNISKKFGCDATTISKILKNKDKIKEMIINNKNVKKKRCRTGECSLALFLFGYMLVIFF